MIKISHEDLNDTLDILESCGLFISTRSSKILCLECFQDDYRVITGDDLGNISLWELDSGSLFHQYKAHRDRIYRITTDKETKLIISSSEDCTVKLWDWLDYSPIRQYNFTKPIYVSKIIKSKSKLICGCKWGILTTLDLNTFQLIETKKFCHREIWNMDINKSEEYLGLACFDRQSIIYSLTFSIIFASNNHLSSVTNIGFIDSINSYVTGEMNGKLTKFSLINGEKLEVFIHNDSIRDLLIVNNEDRIVTASSDCSIKVVFTDNLKIEKELKIHSNYVHSIGVNPTKGRLVSSSWDGTIKVIDLEDCVIDHLFIQHIGIIKSMFFTDNKSIVFTCDGYGFLKVWDMKNRVFLGNLIDKSDLLVHGIRFFKEYIVVSNRSASVLILRNRLD